MMKVVVMVMVMIIMMVMLMVMRCDSNIISLLPCARKSSHMHGMPARASKCDRPLFRFRPLVRFINLDNSSAQTMTDASALKSAFESLRGVLNMDSATPLDQTLQNIGAGRLRDKELGRCLRRALAFSLAGTG